MRLSMTVWSHAKVAHRSDRPALLDLSAETIISDIVPFAAKSIVRRGLGLRAARPEVEKFKEEERELSLVATSRGTGRRCFAEQSGGDGESVIERL